MYHVHLVVAKMVCESSENSLHWTVSNATLADATLVFWVFCSIIFSMAGAPAKKKSVFAKRHLFLHSERVKMLAQGLFGFVFRRCPPSRIFFQFFELSTKAAFAKAAPWKPMPPKFGGWRFTPWIWGVKRQKSLVLQCILRVTPSIWGVKSVPSKFGGHWVFRAFDTLRNAGLWWSLRCFWPKLGSRCGELLRIPRPHWPSIALRLGTGDHWTGSPNQSIDQKGANLFKCCPPRLRFIQYRTGLEMP